MCCLDSNGAVFVRGSPQASLRALLRWKSHLYEAESLLELRDVGGDGERGRRKGACLVPPLRPSRSNICTSRLDPSAAPCGDPSLSSTYVCGKTSDASLLWVQKCTYRQSYWILIRWSRLKSSSGQVRPSKTSDVVDVCCYGSSGAEVKIFESRNIWVKINAEFFELTGSVSRMFTIFHTS